MKLYAISVSGSFQHGPTSSTPPHASLDRYLNLVDDDSKTKIKQFRLLGDGRRCLLGRLLRQHVATRALGLSWGHVTFGQTDKGRPLVTVPPESRLDLNLAHDGDWVVVAFSNGVSEGIRVGVDVMTLRNPWEGETVDTFAGGISQLLSPTERVWLLAPALADATRLARALTLWTLKEAYVKATGQGLHFDLNRIAFDLSDDVAEGKWMEVGGSVDGVGLVGWRFGVTEWRGCVVGWAMEGGQPTNAVGEVEVVRLEEIMRDDEI